MKFTSYTKALKEIGVSYIGGVATSHKLDLSYKNGVSTYGVYLAPATMAISNRNVCPMSAHCREFCLQGAGDSKVDQLSGKGIINNARIAKTKAFWYNRVLFAETIAHEIRREYKKAMAEGRPFSVRLNCTSDISPERLILDNGNNILEEFPYIQFYDYTKVPSRLALMKKYKNYDLTFSFDGHNWPSCKEFLADGGRVAVVFRNEKKLPKFFKGFKVIDGNKYDMRYMDETNVIVGLSFHKTANNYRMENGKRVFVEPNSDFVIADCDKACVW